MSDDEFRGRTPGILDQLRTSEIERDTDELVLLALETMRTQLHTDAAYLAEFVDGEVAIRCAVGRIGRFGIHPGLRVAYEDSLCSRILSGEVSSLVGAASDEPGLAHVVSPQRIGSFVAAGVWGERGQILGMICGLNAEARTDLDLADGHFAEMISTLVAARLRSSRERARSQEQRRTRIRSLLDQGLRAVYQPIVDLHRGAVVGVEALSRFPGDDDRSPQLLFAEAHHLGLGLELELAAMKVALQQRHRLPETIYLSLNASPALVRSMRLPDLFAEVDARSVVLEMTEHASVDDYGALREALQPLRDRGIRLAIDDAGAGFSSFRHILELRPDIIKLDVHLTRDLPRDALRGALTHALSSFALDTDVAIVAEGVERIDVVDVLRRRGIQFAQGHLFAPPGDLPLRHLDYPIIIGSSVERPLAHAEER